MSQNIKIEDFEAMPDVMLNEISQKDFSNLTNIDETNETETSQQATSEPNDKKIELEIKDAANKTSVNIASLLTPELAISLIDSLVPIAFVALFGFAGYKIKSNDLKLSTKEKQDIEGIVQECLSQMNLLIQNPFIALALTLGIFYGSKSIEIMTNAKFEKKAKVTKKPLETIKKDGRGRPVGSTKKDKI